MRKETDDIGPLAELEHWKHRMAKFNSLLEEIRSQNCRIVLSVLAGAQSKVVKVSVNCILMELHYLTRLCYSCGKNWMKELLRLMGKLKTMSSFYIHWRNHAFLFTRVIQYL